MVEESRRQGLMSRDLAQKAQSGDTFRKGVKDVIGFHEMMQDLLKVSSGSEVAMNSLFSEHLLKL